MITILYYFLVYCDEKTLKKCAYTTGISSSSVQFNVNVKLVHRKSMQLRHPDVCPLITGFTAWQVPFITMFYCIVSNLDVFYSGRCSHLHVTWWVIKIHRTLIKTSKYSKIETIFLLKIILLKLIYARVKVIFKVFLKFGHTPWMTTCQYCLF